LIGAGEPIKPSMNDLIILIATIEAYHSKYNDVNRKAKK
jgi:hypothetical protein